MRELIQCGWAHPKITFFIRYHNEEGGIPVHHDQAV